jgi:gliding motility-associated-like protein
LRGNINCPVDEYQLQVFNRWGQKVFDTRDANSGWNGIFKGKQATVGVYVYFVRFKNSVNEKSYKYKKGTFVLLQ